MSGSASVSPAKVRTHGHKRDAPSSTGKSSVKSKRPKLDDSSSMLSLTTSVAFGAREASDDSDLDDDLLSASESERPVNFLPLNTSQLNRDNGVLFSEDLTDNYEVWTLQCPDDVDINQLLKESINFQDLSVLKIENALSHKIDLIPYKSQEKTNITVVVPSERTKNLSLNVVPLAGTLILANRVPKAKPVNQNPFPVDTIEDATRRRSDLMSKITQRLSNKFDNNSNLDYSIKKEFKIEIESPKKIKKHKKKTHG